MDLLSQAEHGTPGAVSLADYDYVLPPQLIAQVPAPQRDGARLLVLNRRCGTVQHAAVRSLPEFLHPGDVVVFNDARVRPARLFGRTAGGGAVELLLLADRGGGTWHCLGRPGRRLRCGTKLTFPGPVEAAVQAGGAEGRYDVRFSPATDVSALLERVGEVPLPPYIKRPDGALPLDRERYQTVFAASDGAVAAPTAGLHFTDALLASLRQKGVELAWLTLHVGPGTFLPIRHEPAHRHAMEAEWTVLPPATVDAVSRARRDGRRVLAVGTTTTRALESAARRGRLEPGAFWADLFIVPGFQFRVVDALLTNFHLPRSTLLLLTCAFAGRRAVLDAYGLAVREGYRFYSYGDAMLIA